MTNEELIAETEALIADLERWIQACDALGMGNNTILHKRCLDALRAAEAREQKLREALEVIGSWADEPCSDIARRAAEDKSHDA